MISEHSSPGAELILKRNQAGILHIRSPKIDPFSSGGLTLFNEFPEQERHATDVVVPFVRTPIFVNDTIFVVQGEHCGDGSATTSNQPDLNSLTHALKQVSEPSSRLWR